jgi:hypothetical protein
MALLPLNIAPIRNTPMGPEKPGPEGTPAKPVRNSPFSPGVRMAMPATFKKGGRVKKTGWAKVHKGETILTKGASAALGAGAKKTRKKAKVKKTMDEWKSGTLHSGSKKGPVVRNQKQAVAIALSQAQKET